MMKYLHAFNNNTKYYFKVEIEKSSKPSSRRNSLPKDNQTAATGVATDNLYPNCDVNVWLRSCEEEIVDPIEGVVSGNYLSFFFVYVIM